MFKKIVQWFVMFLICHFHHHQAEEADWVGLPMPMAVEKAEKELEENTFITPLKDLYVADMVSKFVLREATEAKAKS